MALEIIHGDTQTINVTGLLDADGDPATFTTNDVLRFTAKRWAGQTDAQALIVKTSDDGGITFVDGEDSASIVLEPDDFDGVPWRDLNVVWDLQLAIGGDETNVVTLARGTATIVADITRTVLTGS